MCPELYIYKLFYERIFHNYCICDCLENRVNQGNSIKRRSAILPLICANASRRINNLLSKTVIVIDLAYSYLSQRPVLDTLQRLVAPSTCIQRVKSASGVKR